MVLAESLALDLSQKAQLELLPTKPSSKKTPKAPEIVSTSESGYRPQIMVYRRLLTKEDEKPNLAPESGPI